MGFFINFCKWVYGNLNFLKVEIVFFIFSVVYWLVFIIGIKLLYFIINYIKLVYMYVWFWGIIGVVGILIFFISLFLFLVCCWCFGI